MPTATEYLDKATTNEQKGTARGFEDAARDYMDAAYAALEQKPPDQVTVSNAWNRARVVLAKLPDAALLALGAALDKEDQQSIARARDLRNQGRDEMASESFARAAVQVRLLGECNALLARREPNPGKAADAAGAAARCFDSSRRAYELAAECEGDSPEEQAEAKAEYAEAALVARYSVSQWMEAAHYYGLLGDAGKESNSIQSATAQSDNVAKDEKLAQ